MTKMTIETALVQYGDSIGFSHSENTARTYTKAANVFRNALRKHGVDPSSTPAEELSEQAITWLIAYVNDLSPASERLYVQAAAGFYQFLAAEGLADVNLPKLKLLIRQRARKPGIRLPQFPSRGHCAVTQIH